MHMVVDRSAADRGAVGVAEACPKGEDALVAVVMTQLTTSGVVVDARRAVMDAAEESRGVPGRMSELMWTPRPDEWGMPRGMRRRRRTVVHWYTRQC